MLHAIRRLVQPILPARVPAAGAWAALLVAALCGCAGPEQAELTFPVTIAPAEVVKVEAPYSAMVNAVHVRKGQSVHPDRPVLVELDTSELSLALVQARATLSSLETQAEIFRSRGDSNEAAEVEARIAEARKKVDQRLEAIEKGRITAGIEGKILHVAVSQADRVSRGQALCLVAPADQLYANGTLAGRSEPPFELGQVGRVMLVSDASAAVECRVVAVEPVEFEKGKWQVQLRLVSPGPFEAGMTAQAALPGEAVEKP
ncbi:MAG: biotin/lipoyl-binding protein [Phycisphaerae bacterium]